MKKRGIRSVLELSTYKIGSYLWYIDLEPLCKFPEIEDKDSWMLKHHPKELYTKGAYKSLWFKNRSLPKLSSTDFDCVVPLLTSKMVVTDFVVCDILRSHDTGEFFYCNDSDQWMPESYLFSSIKACKREKTRIVKMIKEWIDKQDGE